MRFKLGAEILPGHLYQTGIFPKGWSGSQRQALLDKHEVRAFATLVNHEDGYVKDWMDHRGGLYIFRPISDGKNIEKDLMLQMAQDIAAEIHQEGGAAVTQCRAGRNRSGLLSVLVLKELGYRTEEAITMVQRNRPLSLYNEHFLTWLRSLP